MRLVRSEMVVYKLAYPRPVRWKDTVEDSGLFMLLRLTADAGFEGVAEAPIKPTWTGTTPRVLAAALQDLLLPALQDADLSDPAAVRSRLDRFPENTLAKGLIDNACWDLHAQAESPLPLVVDARCQTAADARLFLERGARAIGIKPTRVGASSALETARACDRGNVRVNVGLHAESALGSIAASHVAAAFPRHADTLPAETSYYLAYGEQILREPPRIRDGMLILEDEPGFAALIDSDRLLCRTVVQ